MPDAVSQLYRVSRTEQLIGFGQLTMTSEREGSVHRICLIGEFDLATVATVEDELRRVEASDADEIVIDLSGLTFIDSTGLRLMISADARSRADSNRLVLRRGPASVQRAFQLVGLEDRLPFVD